MYALFIVAVTLLSHAVFTEGQYRRVCYYTNWAQYRPKEGKYFPEDIDANLCTHIIYAFAKLKGNRLEAFEWNDESTEWMRGMYDRFNDVKVRNPSVKTLLAVGGWNMASKPFTAMVATPAARREFATTSVRFLRERNFDGLDLDWEYPANRGSPPEDKLRYSQLVSEIRRVFDEEGRRTRRAPLLLTSAVAAGKEKIDTAYDIPSVCRDMDFISVMAYDLHGAWEDITGHNSPLFPHSGETGKNRYLNMDWAANYWVQQGCPKEKLVIGMGLYGRSFTLKDPYDNGLMAPVRGKGEAGKLTREGGFLSYHEVCDALSKGAQSYYIKEQESPYMVNADQWVGYDDVDSLRIKVQWMKQNGFSGVMVWALDLDDYNNRCGQGKYPLLNAINQELLGRIPSQPRSRPNRVKPNPADRPAIPPPTENTWSQPRNAGTNSIATNNNAASTTGNLPHLTNEFDCPTNVNTYFASPKSCEEYYICADGLSFKFKCAPPLKWNDANKFCDWPDNVVCNKSPRKPRPAAAPTAPIAPIAPMITARRTLAPIFRPSNWPTTSTTTTTLPPPSTPRAHQFLPVTNRRRFTNRPVFTTPPTTPYAQPTPPWLDWSTFITEFWRALTSMAGRNGAAFTGQGRDGTLQGATSNSLLQALQSLQGSPQPSRMQPPPAFPNTVPVNAAESPLPPFPVASRGSSTTGFCQGKTDGIHPHPGDCSKYIDCVQGREYPGTCPSGTAFDSTYGVCDYTHKIPRCAMQGR